MKIQTGYCGEVEYRQEDLITVTDGFFGFPDLKQFLLLRLDANDDSLFVMQSVEKVEIAFVVIVPVALCPDYSPVLSEEDLLALGVTDSSELAYYAICIIKEDYLENTVNLKCPLAVHPQSKMARQVILENEKYQYEHKLSSFSCITENVNPQNRSDCYADTVPEIE